MTEFFIERTDGRSHHHDAAYFSRPADGSVMFFDKHDCCTLYYLPGMVVLVAPDEETS